MQELGIGSDSGVARGDLTRIRNQIDRLVKTSIVVQHDAAGHAASVGSLVAERTELWWDERQPDSPVLWESTIELGEKFFQEIIRNPNASRFMVCSTERRASPRSSSRSMPTAARPCGASSSRCSSRT